MRRFRATYRCAAALRADDTAQLSRGGLLLRLEPPDDLALYEPVELEIVFGETSVVLAGQVVQTIRGMGVAIAFDAAPLEGLLERARRDGSSTDEPTDFEQVGEGADDEEPEDDEGAYAGQGPAAGRASRGQMIQLALHGGRDERTKIIRGRDPSLHAFVLKNPKLTVGEVASMAKSATTSPDALKMIAERREWFQRPEVATGLVRNARCPVPIAIKMLDHIPIAELRRIAKREGVRRPILRAARKKVIG